MLPVPIHIPKGWGEWLFTIAILIIVASIFLFLFFIGKWDLLIKINNTFYWVWFVVLIAILIIGGILDSRDKK